MLPNMLAPGRDLFTSAMNTLASAVQGVATDLKDAIPISTFKTHYVRVLDDANEGKVQVISQGRKRYVLLTEEQVIALARQSAQPPTLGEIIRGVERPSQPFAPQSVHTSAAGVSQFTLPQAHGDRGR